MTKIALSFASAILLSAPAAWADYDRDNRDNDEYAQVISAEPISQEVRIATPRDECREEPVTERVVYRGGYYNPGAPILGAIIGGVIGHQFGGGHGRDVATAAGAVIGANAGAANGGYYPGRVVERTRYETVCRPVYDSRYENRVSGYDVAYRWHGRVYHTRTRHDPGSRIRVRVDVAPVDEDDDGN